MGDHPTTVSRGDNFVTEGGSLPRKTKKMLQLVFKMINIITMTIVQEEAGRVGIERGAIGKGSRGIDTMIEERGKGDNAHSGGEEVSEEARESSREEVAMIKVLLNQLIRRREVEHIIGAVSKMTLNLMNGEE
jgi:hypothetical protein